MRNERGKRLAKGQYVKHVKGDHACANFAGRSSLAELGASNQAQLEFHFALLLVIAAVINRKSTHEGPFHLQIVKLILSPEPQPADMSYADVASRGPRQSAEEVS